MIVTLINIRHGTVVRLKVGENGLLSRFQVNKTRRLLCGVAECDCSGVLKELGPQEVAIHVDPESGEVRIVAF